MVTSPSTLTFHVRFCKGVWDGDIPFDPNQLRQFLDYKAIGVGVEVLKVNPAYTSRTCHKCLDIHPVKGKSYRNGKTFKCGHCNWKGDADFNGANMIKSLGLTVNQPGGSYLSCSLSRKVEYFQLS